MDNLTKKQRSYCMSRIKGADTKVELQLRRYIWGKGIRGYRVKNRIKGRPDLYFSNKKIAVFIDGCFWHKCPKCFIEPKSEKIYWSRKIKGNVQRDKKTNRDLRSQGITVLRFWEHEIKENSEKCYKKLKKIYEKKIQNN